LTGIAGGQCGAPASERCKRARRARPTVAGEWDDYGFSGCGGHFLLLVLLWWLVSCGLGDPLSGQAQIDVVERRTARRHRRRGKRRLAQRGDRLRDGVVVERNRDRGADRVRVDGGDSGLLQSGECGGTVAVD